MKHRSSLFISLFVLLLTALLGSGFLWGYYTSEFLYARITEHKSQSSRFAWKEIQKKPGLFKGGIELRSFTANKDSFVLSADRVSLSVYPWKATGVAEKLLVTDIHNTGKLSLPVFHSQANGLVWRFKEHVPEIASYGENADLRLEGSELTWKRWKSRWKPDFEGDFRIFTLESEHFEAHKVGTVQEFHAYLDFPKISLVDEEDELKERIRKFSFSVDSAQWKHADEGSIYQGGTKRLSSEFALTHQKAFSVTYAMAYFKKLFSEPIEGIKTAGREFKEHLINAQAGWSALNFSSSRFKLHSDDGELKILDRSPFELQLTSKTVNWNFDLFWDQYKTIASQLVFKTTLQMDKKGLEKYLQYVFYPKRKPVKQAEESYRLEKLYNQFTQLFNAVQTSGRLDLESLTVGGKGIEEWFQISNVRQEFSTEKEKNGSKLTFQHESILEMDEQLKVVFPDLGSLDNSTFSIKTRLKRLSLNPLHFKSSRTRLARTVMKNLVLNNPEAELEFYHIQDEQKLFELKGYSRLNQGRAMIPGKQQITELSTWLHTFWYSGNHKYLVRIRDKKSFQDVFGSLIVFNPVKKAVQKLAPMIRTSKNRLYLDLSRSKGRTKINYKSSKYFEKAFIKP